MVGYLLRRVLFQQSPHAARVVIYLNDHRHAHVHVVRKRLGNPPSQIF